MVPMIVKLVGGVLGATVLKEIIDVREKNNAAAIEAAKKEATDCYEKARLKQSQKVNEERKRIRVELIRRIDSSNMSDADKKICRDAMNKKVAIR